MTTTTTHSQVSLNELLTQATRPIRLVAGDFYRSLGVKWYAKGLFIKEPTKGSEIKATRLFVVENGDFIYNRLFAWKGSFALCGPEHAGCVVSSEFPTFRVNAERLMPAYLMAFFSNAWLWEMIAGQSSGTAEVSRLRLKEAEFLRLMIPLPPLPEQERLARLLDEADELRKLRAQADRRTADLIPALFNEMFGDPLTDQNQWPSCFLGDLVELGSGATPSKNNGQFWIGSTPWVSPKDMKGDEITDAEDHVSDSAFEQTNLRLIPKDTVLIVVRGMILAHTVPIRISRVAVGINQDVKALLPKQPLEPEFLRWSLQAQHANLLNQVSTAGHGTKRLDSERLKEVSLPVPPPALQQHFAARVTEIHAMETEQAASRRRLDDLFQSLMHRAFTGKLSTQNADDGSLAASLQPTEQLRHEPKVKHSKGIIYRRAALDCYLITALKGDKNLGRTKIEKISHLMEYYCGVDLERVPLRDAAGPNDYPSRMKVESLAKKQKWYFTKKDKVKIDYLPGTDIARSRRTAQNFLGERKSAVDALISLMRPLDTKESEIVATLYAAWNDFLLAGKTPTDDELITEVRHNWHQNKLRIPLDQWVTWLAWMRKNQLIPRGIGKPTIRKKSV